jgi:hypothetical protein
MDFFLRSPYTSIELSMLLSWQQYFNVIFVSDVVNASGDCLLDDIWNGKLPSRCQPDPSQSPPPPPWGLDHETWRHALEPLIRS